MALDQFTRKLTDSGLMSAEQLDAFCSNLPETERPTAADELCQQLVEHDVLTEYQAGALSSDESRPLVVGDYVIQEKVGAGGMGDVFKAQHRRMKRTVALKMLPRSQSRDEGAVRRFEREVEAAGRLSHPNVVAALDARQEDGVDFLIMEYVEGHDLWARVEDQGPLPVATAVDYTLQAATGCQHAHRLGVIHRDIKPSNLLVGADGVVKILDMGLARVDVDASDRLAPTQANLTGENVIMGTLDFVSPEQALNAHRVDHRADIYSLGCTLYYLIAGRPIYDGETAMEKLVGHREQPIPSLREVADGVSEGLDAAFRKMVAKRPEDRFQSMQEVIEALQSASDSTDQPEPPPRRRVPPVADADEDIIFADVIEVPSDDAPIGESSTISPAVPQRSPRRASRSKGPPLPNRLVSLAARIAGLVFGVTTASSIANLLAWYLDGFGVFVAVVFYGWFGWYCGRGYAALLCHLIGWTDESPSEVGGHLFRRSLLFVHVAVVTAAAITGSFTCGPWTAVFIALTALALVDRLGQRRAAA